MQKIFLLAVSLTLSLASFAQAITANSTVASNLTGEVNRRNWSISSGLATATLTSANPSSDYVYFSGFDLSLVPDNVIIGEIRISISRGAGPTVVDSAVRLVLNGAPYYTNNINAVGTVTTWPTTRTAYTYSFPATELGFLKGSDVKSQGFGVAISARRTANSPTATVGTTATITVNYLTLAPLLLADFKVTRTAENQADIRFATSSEENVAMIIVERSGDGKNFSKLFTLSPTGSKNTVTRYAITDKTPLQGINYYRVSELDKNGNISHHPSRMVNFAGHSQSLRTYYNGSQIVLEMNYQPGIYSVSLVDLSGITHHSRTVTITNSSTRLFIDAPSRSGIYIVQLRSGDQVQHVRVAVTR